MKTHHQSGQILLITLLVLSVALTIALSLIGRTTTDISISSQVEESTRAFSAAEAGIEQSLLTGSAPSGTVMLSDSNTQYTVSQNTIGDQDTYDVGFVGVGETRTIWLIHHDAAGLPLYSDPNKYPPTSPIDVCWSGPSNTVSTPALEVTIYYTTAGGLYRVARKGFDQNAGRSYNLPGEDNHYTVPAIGDICNDGGVTDFNAVINFSGAQPGGFGIGGMATMYMMRLRPKYAQTHITLRTTNSSFPLPGLGNSFTSCGASTPGVTRCISANQLYPEPPDIFDYVLYVNNGSLQ